ncbi:hypothetical protein PALB_2460 [Pseudoalteromonas luteoviolacea B = ATCC 29581]|nr:hypothetical protein PALB_2460 [Pseudoalteromonas luteoviolacea B = ATCC 29581]
MSLAGGIGHAIGHRLAQNLGLIEGSVSESKYNELVHKHNHLVHLLNNAEANSASERVRLQREINALKEAIDSKNYAMKNADWHMENRANHLESLFTSLADGEVSQETVAHAVANEWIRRHAVREEGKNKEWIKLHNINDTIAELSPTNRWKANLIRLAVLEMQNIHDSMAKNIGPMHVWIEENKANPPAGFDCMVEAYEFAVRNLSKYEMKEDNVYAWLKERLPILGKEARGINNTLYPDPATIPPYNPFEQILQKSNPNLVLRDIGIHGYSGVLNPNETNPNFVMK